MRELDAATSGKATGRRSGGGPMRAAVGVLGELLATAGVLVLAFAAWQLWWTDVAVAADQADTVNMLHRAFGDGDPAPGAADRAAALGELVLQVPHRLAEARRLGLVLRGQLDVDDVSLCVAHDPSVALAESGPRGLWCGVVPGRFALACGAEGTLHSPRQRWVQLCHEAEGLITA